MEGQPPEPKRVKTESEEREYDDGKCENLILRIITFFSFCEDQIPLAVSEGLIPDILKYSRVFEGGKKADLTSFQSATAQQLRFLRTIFWRCEKISIRQLMETRNLLEYVSNFKSAVKLTITIQALDSYKSGNTRLGILSLKIVNQSVVNIEDSIYHITCRCPNLEKLSIVRGNLTIPVIYGLQFLKSVTLNNITLYIQFKNCLLGSLRNNRKLEKLKLIKTSHPTTMAPFQEAINEILNAFPVENRTLKSLTITMTLSLQSIEHIRNLVSLQELIVYFTAQIEWVRLVEFITLLKEKTHLRIKFIEYFHPPETCFTGNIDVYMKLIKARSLALRQLINMHNPNIKIVPCPEIK